jgi:hypothetical protein
MSTAPSFANYKRLSDPYEKNGKMYIDVEHPNTTNRRAVRWYTEGEVAKNYGKKIKEEEPKDLKRVRGFSKGPILVIRGIRTKADEEWCQLSNARYAVGIGWHIVSEESLPEQWPPHFKFLLLGWNEASYDDKHLKSASDIANILTAKEKKGEYISFG